VTYPCGEIFIVDEDPAVCTALLEVFTRAGYQPTIFMDGTSFVRAAQMRIPTCVLLNTRMPSSSGRGILAEIDARNYAAPVLVLSGRIGIPDAVAAIRNGAFDFIDERLSGKMIAAGARSAITRWVRRRDEEYITETAMPLLPGYDLLTSREREVLFQITAAASIKETGINLGISPRTVVVHRRHIMRKLGAKNSVNLVCTVMNTVRRTGA
jgi:FixJ family two-component response regulator